MKAFKNYYNSMDGKIQPLYYLSYLILNFILEVFYNHTGRIQTTSLGEAWLVVTNSQGRFLLFT